MANKTYWLGRLVGTRRVGVIKVSGKLYAIGESFPADKIDTKKLAGLKMAGCVGSVSIPVADAEPNDARDKDFALLQGRITELTEKGVVDGDRIAELELELEASGDSGDLNDQVVTLNKLIDEMKDGGVEEISVLKIRVAELEPECERLATDNEEKAALIQKLKVEIKALKKELKK